MLDHAGHFAQVHPVALGEASPGASLGNAFQRGAVHSNNPSSLQIAMLGDDLSRSDCGQQCPSASSALNDFVAGMALLLGPEGVVITIDVPHLKASAFAAAAGRGFLLCPGT